MTRPEERGAQNRALLRTQRRRAVRAVCEQSVDAADATDLLNALGLDPREGLDDVPTDVVEPRRHVGELMSLNNNSPR